MTVEQRRRRARIAAEASWAATRDRTARTAPGTNSFLRRFEKQVDPNHELSDELRQILARHARRAYMLQLAERSVQARSYRSATPTAKRSA
jgi:hypothetical protein